MIDANDLMFGDWVMVKERKGNDVKDYPIMVYSGNIGDIVAENLIVEPIPITKDILERNGFTTIDQGLMLGKEFYYTYKEEVSHELLIGGGEVKSYSSHTICLKTNHDGNLDLTYQRSYATRGWDDAFIKNLKYVHELQHALKIIKFKEKINFVV